MSNIDKLKSAAAKAVDNFDPNMFVDTRDVLALLDELEAAEKRIAEQRETLLAARSHVMQCARLGDAHANGVLQAIDRAAAGKEEAL